MSLNRLHQSLFNTKIIIIWADAAMARPAIA
jgi:hypothetical protein